MTIVFWLAVLLAVYPYVLYPFVVFLIGSVRPRKIARAAYAPRVTVLIPAYNEADCIAATVQNKLDQDYPADLLEVIVVSDGSNDGTDEIVKGFAERGVRLLRREGREGKAAALNEAIRHANGEIIIFSDANSIFGTDAIRLAVENFADPVVGYLTGQLRLLAQGDSVSGGSAYIRYENIVRSLETRAGSIIGVNGGVDAIRRGLYVDIPRTLITDFVLPLHVLASGYRVIFDPRVTSWEKANEELSSEFRMRVRVALRALQGLSYMRRLFNPIKHPLVSFCLASHKLLRYFGFLFLPLALIANAVLAIDDGFYRFLLAAHVLAYVLALIGLIERLPTALRVITVVPSYYLMSNLAFSFAALKYLRGETMAVWRPRAG